MDKAPDAFRTISEVATDLDIPQHVLRFWETRFPQIKPMKRSGGRRYYRPDDVDLLRGIRRLLYGEGYTIRGVQRILKEHGIAADAPKQIDIVRAIIAPAAAALHRLDLGEPRFPEPQHVLRNVEIAGDLADGSERIRRLVQMPAPVQSPG